MNSSGYLNGYSFSLPRVQAIVALTGQADIHPALESSAGTVNIRSVPWIYDPIDDLKKRGGGTEIPL